MMENKIHGEPHINGILGMSEVDAIKHLKINDNVMRVINRDGTPLMVTMDVQRNRVNVHVRNGIVTRLENMG